MVIVVKPIIMVINIIPSTFLSARLFSHSRKIPPYSTLDTRRTLSIESSTHVEGNEITAQSKENKDRNEITAQSEQIRDNKGWTVQRIQSMV